jgi:hypothetical protein
MLDQHIRFLLLNLSGDGCSIALNHTNLGNDVVLPFEIPVGQRRRRLWAGDLSCSF